MAMKFGELADRAQASVKPIRCYDDVGALRGQEWAPSRFRLFGSDALDRYRVIRATQAVGLRSGEIRVFIARRDHDQAPCEIVARLIERRSAALDQLIPELEALRYELREVAVVRGSPGTSVTRVTATEGSRGPKGSALHSGNNPD